MRGVPKRYGEDCMTLPATKKNLVVTQGSNAGWDPFEVWRTRVLLPRLAAAREEKKPPAAPTTVPRATR
jgi:hypothetical protein